MNKLPSYFELDRYGLHCRLVSEEDAEFIVRLRTNARIGQFLHSTSPDVEKQREWIRNYKLREESGSDYYFIFSSGEQLIGVMRLYNIHDTVFTAGSWVCSPDAKLEDIIATTIITREIAFDMLNLEYEDNTDGVHINNKQVLKFNKMSGLKETGRYIKEEGEFASLELYKSDFERQKKKLLRLIGY